MNNICEVCGLIPRGKLNRIKEWSTGKELKVCNICREEIREKNKLISYEK